MVNGLEALSELEYPGRFIMMGFTKLGNPTVVYGITGRSLSSQARRLVIENGRIKVQPTDQKILEQGDPNLLVYDAVIFERRKVAVSNGAQTENVYDHGVSDGHNLWSFEPDAPNYTPRISGFMPQNNFTVQHPIMGIIRRSFSGEPVREYFEVPISRGKGRLISTYSGANENPLPSFKGQPLDVEIEGFTARDVAINFYRSLKVKDNQNFRVAVATVCLKDTDPLVYIINRHN